MRHVIFRLLSPDTQIGKNRKEDQEAGNQE